MDLLHAAASALGSLTLILIPFAILFQFLLCKLLELPFSKAGRVNRRESLDEDRGGILAWFVPPKEYEDREVGPIDMEFDDTIEAELGEARNWLNPMRMLSLWARKIIWGGFFFLSALEGLAFLYLLDLLGYAQF